jgi:hypothetical protein
MGVVGVVVWVATGWASMVGMGRFVTRLFVRATNAFMRVTDVFVRVTNVFVRVTNVFVRVTNLFVRVTDMFVRATNLFVRVTNLFVRVANVFLRVTDMFVRVTDMFVRVTNLFVRVTNAFVRATDVFGVVAGPFAWVAGVNGVGVGENGVAGGGFAWRGGGFGVGLGVCGATGGGHVTSAGGKGLATGEIELAVETRGSGAAPLARRPSLEARPPGWRRWPARGSHGAISNGAAGGRPGRADGRWAERGSAGLGGRCREASGASAEARIVYRTCRWRAMAFVADEQGQGCAAAMGDRRAGARNIR